MSSARFVSNQGPRVHGPGACICESAPLFTPPAKVTRAGGSHECWRAGSNPVRPPLLGGYDRHRWASRAITCFSGYGPLPRYLEAARCGTDPEPNRESAADPGRSGRRRGETRRTPRTRAYDGVESHPCGRGRDPVDEQREYPRRRALGPECRHRGRGGRGGRSGRECQHGVPGGQGARTTDEAGRRSPRP